MRSLRTAARTVVLVTLTGAAPGCGYDNPGFKLKDSDPESDSAAQTTSVSGVTMMTTTETSPTTSTTSTSTAEPMTTEGPGVSGSETSGTSADPTTETPETTTGGVEYFFPKDCLEPAWQYTDFQEAAADTFFLHEQEGLGEKCVWPGEHTDQCIDLEFGATKKFGLFRSESVQDGFADEFVSFYAVRFAPFNFVHDDMMGLTLPVMASDLIGIELRLHISHPDKLIEWNKPMIDYYNFTEGDIWPEGPGDLESCKESASSYRCLECPTNGGEGTCLQAWGAGEQPLGKKFGEPFQIAADPLAGADLTITTFTPGDLGFLTKEGVMLVPAQVIKPGMLEIATLQSTTPGFRPALRGVYCKPEPKP